VNIELDTKITYDFRAGENMAEKLKIVKNFEKQILALDMRGDLEIAYTTHPDGNYFTINFVLFGKENYQKVELQYSDKIITLINYDDLKDYITEQRPDIYFYNTSAYQLVNLWHGHYGDTPKFDFPSAIMIIDTFRKILIMDLS